MSLEPQCATIADLASGVDETRIVSGKGLSVAARPATAEITAGLSN